MATQVSSNKSGTGWPRRGSQGQVDSANNGAQKFSPSQSLTINRTINL